MKNEKTLAKIRLLLFLAFSAAIAWALFLSVPAFGIEYGSANSIILLAAAMFAPAIGSLLTRLITKEGFKNMYLRPNIKGNGKSYLLLFFGPTLLIFLSAAVYFLLFPGQFDPELTYLRRAAEYQGTIFTAETMLLMTLLQIVLIGPIINLIPTMGEELGWRGYLLPKLRLFLSDRAALVLTGVIWGLWHTPVIVMGHNYGTGYWGYPWLGIVSMVVFCVVLGVVEGYTTIKLKSAIPAGMIHSAINAGAGFAILLVKEPYNPILGPAITGLLGGLPFAALALVLLMKSGKHKPAVIEGGDTDASAPE